MNSCDKYCKKDLHTAGCIKRRDLGEVDDFLGSRINELEKRVVELEDRVRLLSRANSLSNNRPTA